MELDTPLSGGDRIKIFLFFLLLVGTLFFGVIPILIILAGLYIMKKDNSFSAISSSKKYLKAYLVILSLGAIILGSFVYYDSNHLVFNDEAYQKSNETYVHSDSTWFAHMESFYEEKENIIVETGMATAGMFVSTIIAISLLMWLSELLYFKPLEEHQEWVVNNGVFSDLKEKESDDSTGIMGRDKLSSFSVADELIKWNNLLEKNLISQEEFDKAKQKLLNQK